MKNQSTDWVAFSFQWAFIGTWLIGFFASTLVARIPETVGAALFLAPLAGILASLFAYSVTIFAGQYWASLNLDSEDHHKK
ncbi:MAG: hypothetical protein ABJF50_19410 [Paracoccaceae bacterium]